MMIMLGYRSHPQTYQLMYLLLKHNFSNIVVDRHFRRHIKVNGQSANIAFAGMLDKRRLPPGGEFVTLPGNGWKRNAFDSWTYLEGKKGFAGYLISSQDCKLVFAITERWAPLIADDEQI